MDTLKPLATVETSIAGEMVCPVISLSLSLSLYHTHTHTIHLPHFSLFLPMCVSYMCFVHILLECMYYISSGNYGKLGHGDNATQKVPKLISAFAGKVSLKTALCRRTNVSVPTGWLLLLQVVRHVACGNRHSAAVTIEGDLYTWGEGDHGRLGENSIT